jgi:plastocyanin
MRSWSIALVTALAALSGGCDDDEEEIVVVPVADLGPGVVPVADAGVPAALPTAAAVQVRDNLFTPADVRIAQGGTVTWTWAGSNPHSVTSGTGTPNGLFDSGIRTTGTFQFTFRETGTFPYYCVVHGLAMRGTVVVEVPR